MSRQEFRKRSVNRDDGKCLIPWCDNRVTVDPDGPGEVHHIIERELWDDGGYIEDNGACVCNDHHRMAEKNEIPPQAFWRWANIEEPPVPEMVQDMHVNKWGEALNRPPHWDLREFHKYPSSRHLLPLYWQSTRGTAEERTGRDDTGLTSTESFIDVPLMITMKMDGSNAMLVKDDNEPVRARNGSDAEHESFDYLKQEYWSRNVYENLPGYLQVFGENMYAKHSIHYGCPHDDCDGCDLRNQGPAVDDVFLVFGVYDTRYDLWLSWPEVEMVANDIGFPTVPVVTGATGGFGKDADISSKNFNEFICGGITFPDNSQSWVERTTELAEEMVSWGHEGIIVRSLYPFHYGQFERKLGKYVRPNHVQTDEHWSHQDTVRNKIE